MAQRRLELVANSNDDSIPIECPVVEIGQPTPIASTFLFLLRRLFVPKPPVISMNIQIITFLLEPFNMQIERQRIDHITYIWMICVAQVIAITSTKPLASFEQFTFSILKIPNILRIINKKKKKKK